MSPAATLVLGLAVSACAATPSAIPRTQAVAPEGATPRTSEGFRSRLGPPAALGVSSRHVDRARGGESPLALD